jgi:hypothetical protein
MHNTKFQKWKTRDIAEMCCNAEAWRDAETVKEWDEIFKKHSV